MIIENFAHPLTVEERAEVEWQSGQAVERVIDVKTQFDAAKPTQSRRKCRRKRRA